jgi:hypothetical protein
MCPFLNDRMGHVDSGFVVHFERGINRRMLMGLSNSSCEV